MHTIAAKTTETPVRSAIDKANASLCNVENAF